MGFADVTNDIRQMSGSIPGLRLEAGCWSGTAALSQAIPTTLSYVVGGLIFGHDNAAGRPVVGNTNTNGTVDFTLGDSTTGPGVYIIAGW